jgi:hypothetical protein
MMPRMLDDKVLKTKIAALIEDHSGGMKFTDLVSHLTEWAAINEYCFDRDFVDRVSTLVHREMKGIKVLSYTYRPIKREKLFVYTP